MKRGPGTPPDVPAADAFSPMEHPERLGKYVVTDVLGKGAMGVVYKAYDPDIQRAVAIKTVRRELIEDDERAGAEIGRAHV